MLVKALKTTHIIQANENLFEILCETLKTNEVSPKDGDILVLAETVVATCQNRIIDLKDITKISNESKQIAEKYSMDPRFVEIIMQESETLVGGIPTMILTEKNHVLIANGGIDKSNAGKEDIYSLWPDKPFETAEDLVKQFKNKFHFKNFGIIISDSRVQPVRRGVIGVAIGVAGFEPIIDCRGKCDLYGHKMEYTTRAIADQLSDAAHIVMGECDEQTPFILIRNAPVIYTDNPVDKMAMIMPKDEDLFNRILKIF